jgi:DNA-binding beta-propeller fold protein YncE
MDLFRGGSPNPYVGTPAGVVYRAGHLYICDTDINAVHDWDLAAGRASRIGTKGEIVLGKPVAVAADDAGNLYVADTQRAEVVVFAPSGQAIQRLRPPDRDSHRPVALALHEKKLYVADIAAHVIDVYETDTGTRLETIGQLGSEPGGFYFPMGLAVDATGRLFVSDMLNGRVQVIEPPSEPVLTFGRPGNRYGDLGKPRHLALGPDGVVFVADSEFLHVHLFDRSGRLLMLFGGPDAGDGGEPRPGATPMPVGVASAEGLPDGVASLVPVDFSAAYYVFVTNTVGSRRIGLFAVGAPLP